MDQSSQMYDPRSKQRWNPCDDPATAAEYLAWFQGDARDFVNYFQEAAAPPRQLLATVRHTLGATPDTEVIDGGDGAAFHNAAAALHNAAAALHNAAAALHNAAAALHNASHITGKLTLCASGSLGTATSLPLTAGDVSHLHALSEASSLGVEGRGTVYDPALRKSREIRADDDGPLRLSDELRTFDFAEARQQIQEALCATAVEVEYRPYKLVLYAPGDFFAAHGDSMSDASMFGSLALQIPVAAGCEPGASGDVGGALVFHPGTPREASVDLTTVLPCDGGDGVRVTFAAWLGDVQHEVREVKQPRIVLLYRLFKRGHVRPQLPWAVTSEIRRSLDAVFDTSAPCHLPLIDTVPLQCCEVHEGELPNPLPAGTFVVDPETYCHETSKAPVELSCVGIMLQHQYPPAGLTPTELKGCDAVLYAAVSTSHTCHLVSLLEPRSEPYERRHDADSEDEQPSSEIVRIALQARSMYYGDRYSEVVTNPVVLAAWVPGCGTLKKEGGGNMLGNWDCNTEWWYRSAALIVLPNRWSRCRWFYLAVLKGDAPGLQRLYAVQDVFQHAIRYVS